MMVEEKVEAVETVEAEAVVEEAAMTEAAATEAAMPCRRVALALADEAAPGRWCGSAVLSLRSFSTILYPAPSRPVSRRYTQPAFPSLASGSSSLGAALEWWGLRQRLWGPRCC